MLTSTSVNGEALPGVTNSTHLYLLELGRRFNFLKNELPSKDKKRELIRQIKLYGRKLFEEAIAFYRWFDSQSTHLLERFFRLNPYYPEKVLLSLSKIGDRFPEFIELLERQKGDDDFLSSTAIRGGLRKFFPPKRPGPRFDAGVELTEEHLNYLRKKMIGRLKRPDKIAEREAELDEYISLAKKLAGDDGPRVEHLALAIKRRGHRPILVLPPPSKKFAVWEIEELMARYGSSLENIVPEIPEYGLPEPAAGCLTVVVDPVETSGELVSGSGKAPELSELEIKKPGDDTPGTNDDTGGKFITDREGFPEMSDGRGEIPVPTAIDATIVRTPDTGELHPGASVRIKNSNTVGVIRRKTFTGWVVVLKGGTERIFPDELLCSRIATENRSKPRKTNFKGFGSRIN